MPLPLRFESPRSSTTCARDDEEPTTKRATRAPLRALISGAGAAGLLHALALRAHGAEIVGVYDPSAERAESLASLAGGARVVPSLEALARLPAELACVCGPPATHVAQAELLARRAHAGDAAPSDRIVFVEKPVATTDHELERLLGVPGCVPIVQWRAGRALRAVRDAIALGELGPSPTASADLAWSRDAGYFASGKGDARLWGCGALLSVGIHAVDALFWALGRPVETFTGMLGYRPGVELETSAAVHFALRGGAIGSVRLTLDGGPDRTRLSFCGGGVTAEIVGGEADPTAARVLWHATSAARRARLEAIEAEAEGSRGSPLLVPFLGDALRAIEAGARPGDRPALPGVRDVYAAHRAITRLYAAAARSAA